MNFNPNTPDTLGVELRPTVEADVVLTSAVRGESAQFTAQATQTITQAAIYAPTVREFAFYELEIFEADTLGDLTTTTTAFPPALDVRNTNAFAQFDDGSGGNSVDIWQAIDSYPAALFRGKGEFFNSGVPIDNDELIYPTFGNALDYAARFNGVVGTVGNARITNLRVQGYFQQYVDIAFVAGMSVTPYLLIAGVKYYGSKVAVPETAGGYFVSADWPINPSTGCSWTIDDLEQFDYTTMDSTSGAGWYIDATGSSNNLSTILQGWLQVEYCNDATDPRVAKGCLQPTVPGWWTFDIANPVTGAGWAKTSGTEYIATLRRRHENGKMGWRYLAGDIAASHFQSHELSYTTEKQLLRSIGDETGKAFSLVFLEEDDDVSIDSQPYASIDGDQQLDLGINSDWSAVNIDQTIEQEFTTVGADTYAWVRIMARLDEGGLAIEPLTVRVVNGADVQQGATLTFVPADLESPRQQYQMLEGSIGATALLAATQYRFIIESDAEAGAGWRVQILSAYPNLLARAPLDIEDATYGGATDAVTVDAVRYEEMDAVVTIATQPAVPEDLAVTVATGAGACDEFPALTWTATDVAADAGEFMRYEVDYSADGTTWERIGEITDEDVEELEHHEAKRNTLASYRIRVRRTDWSASDWSETVTVTPEMECCGFLLTTNVAPELTYWVDDVGPERETQPLQIVSVQQYHGRDHSVGHHGLEWQGVSFTRTLLIATEGVVDGNATPDAESDPEDDVYGRLLAFLPAKGAALPYVCVLDQNGNRWFCTMEIGRWLHDGFGNTYTAEVKFTTVTDIPSPTDVEP